MTVFTSSLRDGLLDYIETLERDALEQFRHAQLLFVAGGMRTAPPLPPILRIRQARQARRD
jgi:hypothetical protein